MHASDSIDRASMLHSFESDGRLSAIGFLFFTIRAFVVFVQGLVHVAPFHCINPILRLLLGLRSSYHVRAHWVLVISVLHTLLFVHNGVACCLI